MATLDLAPADYWARFDPAQPVASVIDALGWARQASDWVSHRTHESRPMVYRGQADADWGLRSSLARQLPHTATELDLVAAEKSTLAKLRTWQLQLHPAGGLLPALPLFSTLQHLGGRTRLIDVSHNVAVALWFAVEPHQDADDKDGRLFAMTYASDLSTQSDALEWEAEPEPFWWRWKDDADWPNHRAIMIWSPPPLERRMIRQSSAFVIGRMASEDQALRSLPNTDFISVESWRQLTSISKRAYRLAEGGGAPPTTTEILFTARVPQDRKDAIRTELEQLLGLSARTMYPDLPGFVKYA